MLKQFPRRHLIAASLVSFLCSLILVMSPGGNVEARRITSTLPIELDPTGMTNPTVSDRVLLKAFAGQIDANDVINATSTLDIANQIEDSTAGSDGVWQSFEVNRGDTLSTLFQRAGFDNQTMYQVLQAKDLSKADRLDALQIGQSLDFGADSDGTLQQLIVKSGRLESLDISLQKDGNWVARKAVRKPDVHITYAHAVITDSLFGAGKQAGLTDKQILTLATIFGWDIDFALDIREGDEFGVMYQALYLDGEKIGDGDIVSAYFVNQGKKLEAIRYTNANGTAAYYTPKGNSMRKAFLRSPVDFARISSTFSLGRYHPILHKIRAHKGTDYAAPTGTPIKASGDGKVIFAGRKSGYGNVVILQHGHNISTFYAHMKAFARGVRTGKNIDQGQVIGYIGSTGLATGPHLHYEFRLNGVAKNSLTVALPNASPVPADERQDFAKVSARTLAQLKTFDDARRINIARNDQ